MIKICVVLLAAIVSAEFSHPIPNLRTNSEPSKDELLRHVKEDANSMDKWQKLYKDRLSKHIEDLGENVSPDYLQKLQTLETDLDLAKLKENMGDYDKILSERQAQLKNWREKLGIPDRRPFPTRVDGNEDPFGFPDLGPSSSRSGPSPASFGGFNPPSPPAGPSSPFAQGARPDFEALRREAEAKREKMKQEIAAMRERIHRDLEDVKTKTGYTRDPRDNAEGSGPDAKEWDGIGADPKIMRELEESSQRRLRDLSERLEREKKIREEIMAEAARYA